ncbi:DUF4241 domain-containing protein [Microbulbifer aggregans]|uniref:DUF4241 domain-containing protein n=1 Tax=Microbulbifer aggregans TaxID=1769779 RepID=UPI001CFD2E84|nr:DUF4241 domain-containing protein [Microbulbifer aggregans]
MEDTINSHKNNSSYDNLASSPEDRVKAFISHWHEQWSKTKRTMGDVEDFDFDYWGEQISEVDKTHFFPGSSSNSAGSFMSKATYDPKTEKIAEYEIRADSAQVFTEIYDEDPEPSKYHVYDLKMDAKKGWKIKDIFTLYDPPKSPVIDIDKHAEILGMSSPDAPFMDREDYFDLDENILFQQDRNINTPDLGEGIAKLEQIGKLRVTSGILGILDFGYDIYDFEPLQKKIKPGDYPVETVTIYNRVAGLRVKFSQSEKPVKWYAANTPSCNGVYGVDAGNLAIFDVSSLLSLNHLGKEKIFYEWYQSGKPDLLSMTDKEDCVISPSGFGDGAYGAFWGVNQQDEAVSLYIDFLILVDETEDGIFESI